MAGQSTPPAPTGDRVTNERIAAGMPPDCHGWKALAEAVGHDIAVRTLQRWADAGTIPVFGYGGRAAGYGDRIRACLMSQPPRRSPRALRRAA